MTIKKLGLAFLVLYLFSFSFGANNAGQWHSFNEGLKEAEESSKPALIDFYTDWCHWCDVMDEKTFSNDTIAEYLNENFVTIRLNAEDQNTNHTFQGNQYNSVELTRAFNVTGYPSIAFLDNNQEVITVIPGYIPADQFIKILEYIDRECYKKQISFEEYLKNGCEQKS